jgi:hypothetical protein
MHEWLPVSQWKKFKEWGVNADDVWDSAVDIAELNTKTKGWTHGGKNSTKVHNTIIGFVEESKDFDGFKKKMQIWARTNLKGGINDLPDLLRI